MEKQVPIKGRFTTWTLTNTTPVEAFQKGLAAIDLERFAPDEVSRLKALRSSLQKVCARGDRLVRPLPQRRGYAIVSERSKSNVAGGDSIEHHVDYHSVLGDNGISFESDLGTPVDADTTVWRDPTVPLTEEETAAQTYGDEWRLVRNEFARQIDLLPSDAVAGSLTKIVDWLHGVPIRPTGGVYWIPDSSAAKWAQVSAVIARTPGCEVFCARTVVDDEGTRMVNVALVNSVSKELDSLTAEFAQIASRPNNRESTWEKKRDRIERLRKRAVGYEAMLGITVSDLKAKIEEVDGAAAVAAFAAQKKS